MTDTLTRIRPAFTSERGDQIPDWLNASEAELTGCRVQPMAGEEVTEPQNRDSVTTAWKVYAPSGTDVRSTDRIRYAGTLYEVNGSVRNWPSPTGTLASTQFELRRVDG